MGITRMLLTHKKWLLLIVASCFAIGLRAQTRIEHNIAGFVCTRGTTVRVAQGLVTNKNTNAVIVTDELGSFTIKAAIGDTLEFAKTEYTPLKVLVNNTSDMVVFIQKAIMLKQVDIVGQTKQQEVNSYIDDYRKKGVYAGGKPSALSAVTSPLNALYSVFGKDAKDARHFAAMSKKDLEAAQDSRKYNKMIVKRVTNMSDEEIPRFMEAYTPSHEDLLKWGDYEVIEYIRKSYKSYKELGVVSQPKLNDVTPPVKQP
ncbi:hypothetical protein HQ865_19005 [Mucilaginibacter mali]|uniref:Carboxypeptidase-like protein n=1 Tax=Mucilaginibacter mali TaxID=2740462 RepID=A0A7D4Q5L4_9SPHI|nr:hypothetical protein [Mucilaginibacter mali]QKJ31767.1 hypothetical protein HQ865_19005 [Mucilaginibacter mali]